MTDKKFESTAMPTVDDEVNLSNVPKQKTKKLKLDNQKSYRPAKTRAELYREMAQAEEIIEKDVIEFTTPARRGGALLIDLAFIYLVVDIALMLAPYELALMKHFLDLYKHEFIFANQTMLDSLDIFNVTSALFFALLLPLSFFNSSLGKKIMKLRVRGDQAYTISLSKAFQRELIFKPISMLLVVGFIMPFFSENQQSLHDKMAGTLVIKD
jgi:uncharacterized RDD family membrane protein YckC